MELFSRPRNEQRKSGILNGYTYVGKISQMQIDARNCRLCLENNVTKLPNCYLAKTPWNTEIQQLLMTSVRSRTSKVIILYYVIFSITSYFPCTVVTVNTVT